VQVGGTVVEWDGGPGQMQCKGRLQALMSEDDVAAAQLYRDERILPRIAESWREEQVSHAVCMRLH
jgi:hypothetical protein